tara:strand:+ start:5423 stop:5647 length:225 start_codon:yes stop_codon:yes gene_type:complete
MLYLYSFELSLYSCLSNICTVVLVYFDIVFEKQEEGGYTVYVPALQGCISEGNTKAQAMKNIKEAISLYLEENN